MKNICHSFLEYLPVVVSRFKKKCSEENSDCLPNCDEFCKANNTENIKKIEGRFPKRTFDKTCYQKSPCNPFKTDREGFAKPVGPFSCTTTKFTNTSDQCQCRSQDTENQTNLTECQRSILPLLSIKSFANNCTSTDCNRATNTRPAQECTSSCCLGKQGKKKNIKKISYFKKQDENCHLKEQVQQSQEPIQNTHSEGTDINHLKTNREDNMSWQKNKKCRLRQGQYNQDPIKTSCGLGKMFRLKSVGDMFVQMLGNKEKRPSYQTRFHPGSQPGYQTGRQPSCKPNQPVCELGCPPGCPPGCPTGCSHSCSPDGSPGGQPRYKTKRMSRDQQNLFYEPDNERRTTQCYIQNANGEILTGVYDTCSDTITLTNSDIADANENQKLEANDDEIPYSGKKKSITCKCKEPKTKQKSKCKCKISKDCKCDESKLTNCKCGEDAKSKNCKCECGEVVENPHKVQVKCYKTLCPCIDKPNKPPPSEGLPGCKCDNRWNKQQAPPTSESSDSNDTAESEMTSADPTTEYMPDPQDDMAIKCTCPGLRKQKRPTNYPNSSRVRSPPHQNIQQSISNPEPFNDCPDYGTLGPPKTQTSKRYKKKSHNSGLYTKEQTFIEDYPGCCCREYKLQQKLRNSEYQSRLQQPSTMEETQGFYRRKTSNKECQTSPEEKTRNQEIQTPNTYNRPGESRQTSRYSPNFPYRPMGNKSEVENEGTQTGSNLSGYSKTISRTTKTPNYEEVTCKCCKAQPKIDPNSSSSLVRLKCPRCECQYNLNKKTYEVTAIVSKEYTIESDKPCSKKKNKRRWSGMLKKSCFPPDAISVCGTENGVFTCPTCKTKLMQCQCNDIKQIFGFKGPSNNDSN